MSKAIIFSDAHLCPQNFDAGQKLLGFVLEQAIKHKADHIFNLGDTFHYKNEVFVTVLDQYRSFLLEVSKIAKVIQIVGNHDYGREYDKHALQPYLDMNNVVTVNGNYKLNDKIGFMSFARDDAKFKKEFKPISDCSFVFGHFDINGFNLGSGWEEQHSYNDGKVFSKQEKVFSGHYHLAQTKKIGKTEITYVGTGFTTSFGESDQEKRIILFDMETGEWESISTGMTLHKTIRIKHTDTLPEIPEDEVKAGVKFRVVIEGPKEYLEKIKKPNGYPAKIDKKSEKEESVRLKIDANMSKKDILGMYLEKEFPKYGLDLDVEKLKEIGEIYLGDMGDE